MDLVGPLPLSNNKNKYILTIFNHFSCFVVRVPIPDKSSKTVCSSIYTRWIAIFGSPNFIRTDARTEFANNLLSNMMLKMGVKISAPYNHQSNHAERFHRTLWNLLMAKIANGEKDLDKSLPLIELAYNLSIHASTGCSPSRFFLGREVELPQLLLLPKFQDLDQHPEPFGLEEDID